MFEEIPLLGAGLGYQFALHDEILASREEIDFLEIPTDRFLSNGPDWSERLPSLRQNFTTVAHGIYMSLGDASGPHLDYLERLAPYIETLDPVWFSDHLDMGNMPDDELGAHFHGMQIPFTRAQAAVVRENMRVMTERIRLPLLVENIFYKFVIPMPDSLSEPAFIGEILEGTDCGLLLDVTNMHINALNFGFDPYDWLALAPLDHVIEIHLAGGQMLTTGPWEGKWADTHSQPVPDEVWKLVEYVVKRAPVKGLLLERDQNYPPMQDLLAELRIARGILAGAQPGLSEGTRNSPGRSLTPKQT